MCCDDSCSDNCRVVFFVISLHLRTRQRTHFHAPTIQTNSFCFGSNTYIYIYQSQNLTVASARNWRVCRQGRRGQGSRRQGRGRHGRTGQGRGTYQKRTEQKQSRAWAKSRAGHDGHCAIWISKCAGQGQNAEQGKKGQNKVSRFGQL